MASLMALGDGGECPAIAGGHGLPGDGPPKRPAFPAAPVSLRVTDSRAPPGWSSRHAGQLRQVPQHGQARQQRGSLVLAELDRPVQVQVLGDVNVVVFPLDIEQVVRVTFRQPRTNEDFQVVHQLPCG